MAVKWIIHGLDSLGNVTMLQELKKPFSIQLQLIQT